MDAQAVRQRVEKALRDLDAEYVGGRLEEARATRLQYRGKEIEEVETTASLGGNVRALVKGAWGFVSFNDIPGLKGLKEKVALAVRQARLAGKEDSYWAALPPRVDIEPSQAQPSPVALPLAHKKELLDRS